MLRYLKYEGFVILQWQRAARNAEGLKLKKLFAYSHHVFRSVCHKPVCAQVLSDRSARILLCIACLAERAASYNQPFPTGPPVVKYVH